MSSSKPTIKSVALIGNVQEMKSAMAHVLQDAQMSLSSHKKLVIVMKSIFHRAIELNYEEYFGMYFTKLINKVLPLKKGEQVGDNIAKFCSSFVRSLNADELEKRRIEEEQHNDGDGDEDENMEEDFPVDMFVKYLIHHLMRGIESKDRNVRYRVVQLLAYLVNQILEIDYETYTALYTSLSRRLFDKESMVRIQALVSLSKFQVYDFDIEGDEGNDVTTHISKEDIRNKIIMAINNDESAELRRAALINLSRTRENIPYLIDRARDTNSINRRLVFSRVSKELGDFRRLNSTHRENLLRWGLNDREEAVQNAATKMFAYDWYDASNEDLIELLENIDVLDSNVAEKALYTFFKTRSDKFYELKFDSNDWKSLSVEKAFLIRMYYYYCNDNRLYDLIDANFPESINLADTLAKYLSLRSNHISKNEAILNRFNEYQSKITDMDNQIFPVQSNLMKLKNETEHAHRSYKKAELVIEELKYHNNACEDRIQKLEDGTEEVVPIEDEEAEVTEEEVFNSLSIDELKTLIDENNQGIKARMDIISKNKKVAKDTEKEFNKVSKKLQKLINVREEKHELFGEIEHEYTPFNDTLKDLDYIIQQLLLISKEYDFSDEIGRRRMLQIIRSTLTDDDLSEPLIETALKVLRKISISERDFTTMCTEIISDLRDSSKLDEESFHSAISDLDEDDEEEREKENELTTAATNKKRKVEPKSSDDDDITMKCLITTQHMLELSEEQLDHNLSLNSLRYSLINYAIQQFEKVQIYSRGLICLGLFTLLDESSVSDSIHLFNLKLRDGTEDIRIIAVRAIVDILSIYGSKIINSKSLLYSIARNFHKNLNEYDMPKLQCIVAEGVAKLFLADIFGDSMKKDESIEGNESAKQLFESLVLSYFHPSTQKNQELKQILAFCIPVYAFSHPNHQVRLASISGDCVFRMFLENGEFATPHSNITPVNVVQQLIYWCDPNNLVNMPEEEIKKQTSHVFQSISLLQAVEQESSKAVKKAIINNLNKLYIHEDLRATVLQSLLDGVKETKECMDSNKENPEFMLDKLTLRNFDNFYSSIEALHDAAVRREDRLSKDGINSFSHSREGSVSHIKEETNNTSFASSRSVSRNTTLGSHAPTETDVSRENNMQTPASDGNNNLEDDDQAEEFHSIVDRSTNHSKSEDIDSTLQKIDQLLAEEEDVDYDISMADE